jgi:5-formyltetrahydrofolate cyclo-ligase
MPAATPKPELRRTARQMRRAMPAWRRRRAALRIARLAPRVPALRRGHRVALYLAAGLELDTAALITTLRRHGFTPFVPVVCGSALRFAPLAPVYRRHALGMLQPESRVRLPVRAMHCVLIPLLAFDAGGRRLGQGGGFYDRTLAQCGRWPHRVGLAFAAQQLARLPADAHDVPLHAVLTERGYRHFFDRP